jgi:cytochrome c5
MEKKGSKLMKQRTLILALALGVILSQTTFWQAQGASPTTPSVPKGWKFSFPDGDPKAGKTVFMNMQCYSCHAIQIPGEKLPSDAAGIGPELTGYSALPKEYLAESIIKAHTVVAAPGYAFKGGKASMGNYNHFMTIQEMIDIVAFLKHGLGKR